MREILRRIGLWFCRHGWHGKITYTAWDGCSFHLTPESAAKQVEYARIGRAVVEWLERVEEPASKKLPLRIAHGYVAALSDVSEVIAKAKGGAPYA